MTKAEIVSKICEKLGVEKSDAHEIVNMFMSEIKAVSYTHLTLPTKA